MQRSWRIINKKHAVHAFDGEGSRRYGSRWTSPEVRVVHASANLSLALLEVLVHLKVSAPLLAYLVYTVDFSEDLVEELDEDDLPENWRSYPAPAELRVLGDVWFRSESSAFLRVPSVIIPHECNYLINPLHKDFSKSDISKPEILDIDPRLFGR